MTEVRKGGGAEEPTRPVIPAGALLATRILCFWDGGSETRVLGPDSTLTIGRSADCDIVVDLPSVSRKHAQIKGGAVVEVSDLGGVNGVRVRGEVVGKGNRAQVHDGDVIELGGAVVVVQGARATASKKLPLALIDDEPMKVTQHLVSLVAPSDISVLLLGETGVGKTICAKEIHARSPRARGPFVRINCAAMPEALLEGELFGYERGAFTGATQAKPGLFETAAGGTMLLDEIGEMPLATQAKLLTVVETREVMRLGAVRPRPIDVRFISATNRDLFGCAQEGTFRADLYYRLNGISIVVPPLRERRTEIEGFAKRFLAEACARAGRKPATLSGESLAILLRYPFPGNLRELRNTMDRAAVLSEGGPVHAEHLLFEPARAQATPANAWSPAAFLTNPTSTSTSTSTPTPTPTSTSTSTPTPTSTPLKDQVEAFERERIVKALADANGNQTRAAVALGMSRRALVTRIEQYGLPRPRKR